MANYVHIEFVKLKKKWEPILTQYSNQSLLTDFNTAAKASGYPSPDKFPIFMDGELDLQESFERWLGQQTQLPYIDSADTTGSKFKTIADACQAMYEFVNTVYIAWDRGEMYSAGQLLGGAFYNSKIQNKKLESTSTIGGVAKGTMVSELEGLRFSELIDRMFFPRIYPSVSAPEPTVSAKSSILEVGVTFNKNNFTINANRGQITLNGERQDYARGVATIDEGTFTNNGVIVRGTNTGTFVVSYAQGPQPYDTYGDPYGSPVAAASFTKSANITGVHACYYGVTADLTEDSIKQLKKDVRANAKGITVGKQQFTQKYVVIAIPNYFNINKLTNNSGLDETNLYAIRTDIMSGYKVYVSPLMDQPATYSVTTS